MIVSKFDLIQLFFGIFQIFQNIGAGYTVFSAELMDNIQSLFDLVQFLGRIA